jgi:hypothetical protein
VQLFGSRDYAMRIWIDPDRAAALDLTAGEIVSALRAQNVQVSAGSIGQPPYDRGEAFQLGIEMQGRLTTPDQFSDIVIRSDADGHQVRVRDVARVELGAQDYGTNTYLSNKPTVVIATMQRPGSNALDAAEKVKAEMASMSPQARERKRIELELEKERKRVAEEEERARVESQKKEEEESRKRLEDAKKTEYEELVKYAYDYVTNDPRVVSQLFKQWLSEDAAKANAAKDAAAASAAA